MSHTVKVNVEFKNMNSLKNAFQKLGWTIEENKKIRAYSRSQEQQFPTVAVNPRKGSSAYDIGITEQDEKIDLFTDFYGGSVEATLGQGLGKLKQEYAADVLQSELSGLGFMTSVTKDEQGNLVVEGEQA